MLSAKVSLNPKPLKPNLKYFLASKIAKLFPKVNFISVLGIEGKSTTVFIASQILSKKYAIISSNSGGGNINEIVSLIYKLRSKDQKIIYQQRLRRYQDFKNFETLISPQNVILTTLTIPQDDFLGDINYFKSQVSKLLDHPNIRLIANFDDENCRAITQEREGVIYYGFNQQECHVWASNAKIVNFKTKFELNYGVERVEVHSPFLGFHQIYPQLAAATLAITLNIPLTTVKNVLESLPILPSHMEASLGYNGSYIIDDSCQLSVDALIQAIETLNHVAAKHRIAIISGVADLGNYQKNADQKIALKIFKQRLDYLFLIGNESQGLKEELLKLGFPNERMETEVSSYQQIITKVLKLISRGDVVLIKIANKLHPEEIVSRLTKLK